MPGGRPRKPAALKVLQGNPGKRPIPKEPKPQAATELTPPAFLGLLAREEWERIAPEILRLGLLTVVDTPTLAGYCHKYECWRRAAAAVAECPSLGEAIARGFVKAEKDALTQMVQLAAQFGFTPASRSKVSGAGKPEEEDPFREFEVHDGGKR